MTYVEIPVTNPVPGYDFGIDRLERMYGLWLASGFWICTCSVVLLYKVACAFFIMYVLVTSVYVCYTAGMHAGTKLGISEVLSFWVLQMRERFIVLNWILSERVTAVAAPLYQNIPVGNLTGYTVDIRVTPLAHAPHRPA